MTGNFKITDPDEVDCTLEITMPLVSWKQLRDQLGTSSPSWKLAAMIRKLIEKAEKEYLESGEFKE